MTARIPRDRYKLPGLEAEQDVVLSTKAMKIFSGSHGAKQELVPQTA